MNINSFSRMMNTVTVTRDGCELCKAKALHDDPKKLFHFPPDKDYRPQEGDIVSYGGRDFTLTEAYEEREMNDTLYAYVGSYKQKYASTKAGDTFNIHGNVSGSIIGSSNTATITNIEEATSNLKNTIQREVTDPDDKALLEKMTTYVEMMIENNQPM